MRKSTATTLSDVARVAGVHMSTVSRALKDDKRILPDTRERIKRIASELGYRPNHVARTLAVGRSRGVGVIVPSSSADKFLAIHDVVAAQLAASDHPLTLYSAVESLEGEALCLERLLSDRIAGQ